MKPESAPLHFPSSLPPEICLLPELEDICRVECCLCQSQADDALADICHLHCVIQGFWYFKKANLSGTRNKPNTRMLNSYKQMNCRLQCAIHCYCTAYAALVALNLNGSWTEHLKVLNPADIRGPGRDPDSHKDTGISNGQFTPSWIWLVLQSPHEEVDDQTEDRFNDSMHAEWAQIRARKCQWDEELLIIQEEMHCIIAFF